jgi:DNA-3-methyladenine glycosylase II
LDHTAERVEIELRARPPFALDTALRYLRLSPSTIAERVEDGCYERAIWLGDRPALVRVVPSEQPDVLRASLHAASLRPGDEETLRTLVRRVFGLDDDLAPLEAIAPGDPIFGALVRRYRGVRPVLIAEPLETLIWAIIGQQINVAFAAKLKRALIECFGERLRWEGRTYLLFPRAETLAALRPDDLRPLQFSRQKIAYVVSSAAAVASGALDLTALASLPTEEALAILTALRGVGRWTAEYVLMRGAGHRDVIPAADGGLRRVIGQAYGLGRLATEGEVRALAERWVGWRSYAAFYWWFALQEQSAALRAGTTLSAADPRPAM